MGCTRLDLQLIFFFLLEYVSHYLQQHKLEYDPYFIDQMYFIPYPLQAGFVIVNRKCIAVKPEHIFL